MITEAEDIIIHTSDEEEDNVNIDTCSPSELETYFQYKYKIHDETSVASEDTYVLSLAKDHSFTCIAAGLSNGSVTLFDVSSERGLYITAPRTNDIKNPPCICGVRFLDETPNLLLVGTTNGLVRLIDLRTQNEVARFECKDSNNILCFDYSCNSRMLCMGTETKGDTAYLIFDDIRKARQSHVYTMGHEDDITSLKFHPQNPNILCSGSVDGLINIYDIRKKDEYSAILNTINTESSVYKVNWHKNEYNKYLISCITHTNDFKLYDEECDLVTDLKRAEVRKSIKCRPKCDIIDCHSMTNGELFLLTCSNLYNGSIMRSLRFQNNQLLPFANFKDNKQIVRESILDLNSNVLVTGGEKGIVTLWTPQNWDSTTHSNSSELKMKAKKSNKVNPY